MKSLFPNYALLTVAILVAIMTAFFPNTAFTQADHWTAAMQKWLATPEADADNNGFVEYTRAIQQFDTNLFMKNDPAFQSILKNGWTRDFPQARQALNQCRPIFSLIWEGNQKPRVIYPHWSRIVTDPVNAPVPNFLKIQLIGKLMVAQALLYESQGKPDLAISTYQTLLHYAGGFSVENAPLISKLISVALQSMALKQIEGFIQRSSLSEAQYTHMAEVLGACRMNQTPTWVFFKGEAEIHILGLQNMINMTRNMQNQGEYDKAVKEAGHGGREMAESIGEAVKAGKEQEIIQEMKLLWETMIEEAKKPFPEFHRFDAQKLLKSMNPAVRITFPNILEARIREEVSVAHHCLAWHGALLKAHKARTGSYPSSLNMPGLAFPQIVDPFTGEPMKYRIQDGKALIYSLGPDMKDQKAGVSYDPRNGSQSAGDIFLVLNP